MNMSKAYVIMAIVLISSTPVMSGCWFTKAAWTAAGVATVAFGGPVAIGAIGFTASGITAGSTAAGMMAAASPVAAGSTVAVLQSVGAAGFSIGAKLAGGAIGYALAPCAKKHCS